MNDQQLNLFTAWGLPVLPEIDESFPNNESGELEYKSAAGGFPADFWKTYSAFANTQGGVILLGINERKGRLVIEGLDVAKLNGYKKHFWDNANNPNTVSANLLQDADVKPVEVAGKTLLGFRIPAAMRAKRPVFLTRNPFGNTYKRNHEGDYACTPEEVRRMLADADLNTHPDSRIPEGFSMGDIDPTSLKQYRQLFAVARPGHAWLSLEDKELLTQLGAYRKDRLTHREGPTIAGLLMFGKETSITDPEAVPNFFPDFREVLSPNPDIRWTDRIYPDGTWEANLFQFYRRVWPRLSSSLPKPFQLKRGQRQDETPAHTALREAFVNALIHADYSAPGNIVIEQKTDTYQFSNPGTLLVSIQQYYTGGISECRNTSLQKMFLMIGSAEKAGSGVSKIMAGWDYAHWRKPYISIDSQPDRVVLELPMFSILPNETLAALRNRFGDNVDTLGKDELMILATCQIEGEVSNSRLQYMIRRHPVDITKVLQDLCKQDYLVSESKNRWTTYHLNKEFGGPREGDDGGKANSGEKVANSEGGKVARWNKEAETSEGKVETLIPKGDTYYEEVDASTKKVATSEGGKVASSEGGKVARSALGRLNRSELKKLILQVCTADWKTIKEIAEALGLGEKYLRNKVIPEMADSGTLLRKFPKVPNHKDQAYKAATHET